MLNKCLSVLNHFYRNISIKIFLLKYHFYRNIIVDSGRDSIPNNVFYRNIIVDSGRDSTPNNVFYRNISVDSGRDSIPNNVFYRCQKNGNLLLIIERRLMHF